MKPLTPLQALKGISEELKKIPHDSTELRRELSAICILADSALFELHFTPTAEPVNTVLLNALKKLSQSVYVLSPGDMGVSIAYKESLEAIASAEQPDEPITWDAIKAQYSHKATEFTIGKVFRIHANECVVIIRKSTDKDGAWRIQICAPLGRLTLPIYYYTMSQVRQLIAALSIGVEKGAGE